MRGPDPRSGDRKGEFFLIFVCCQKFVLQLPDRFDIKYYRCFNELCVLCNRELRSLRVVCVKKQHESNKHKWDTSEEHEGKMILKKNLQKKKKRKKKHNTGGL